MPPYGIYYSSIAELKLHNKVSNGIEITVSNEGKTYFKHFLILQNFPFLDEYEGN